MKFAVIQTGGKQYIVSEHEVIRVEKLDAQVESEMRFDSVLSIGSEDGSAFRLGTPYIAGSTVTAKIMKHGRARKVRVVKYKSKTRQKSVRGHRQPYTEVQILSITS